MKISFNKKEISEVLSRIQGITGRKTNLSITSDILIKAVGNSITIVANDLETAFSGTYEAQVEKEGILTINSKKLSEIVREYPDVMVQMSEVENRWVEIGKNDSIFHIVASDYKNFPQTPVIENIDFISVQPKAFKKMIEASSVIGFSGEEKRTYVIGSLIEKITDGEDGDRLRIVSTDSRRLHCCEAPIKGNLYLPDDSVIVPKKGLSELVKFIDTTMEEVRIGIKDNHFVFQSENETIMIKLLDDEYPDYKPVINYSEMIPVEVDRHMFYTLMKRVSILTSDDYKSVVLNFKNNEMIVTITNPEIGESKEQMAVSYSSDEIKSAFNPRYFMDALNMFDDNTVVLHVKDNKSPCIIKGMDNDQLICVIMAMHIL